MLLLTSCFPEGDQVIELAFFVFAHLKDDGVKPFSHPPDGPMLFRQIGTIVLLIRAREYLLHLFKPNTTFSIRPQPLALAPIEVESHRLV